MVEKSWKTKLGAKNDPKTKRINFGFADTPAGNNMYIATPKIIQEYIDIIPMGREVDWT